MSGSEILKVVSAKHGELGDAAVICVDTVHSGRSVVNKIAVSAGGKTYKLIEKIVSGDLTELHRYELLRDYGINTAMVYSTDTDKKILLTEDLSGCYISGREFDERTDDGYAFRNSYGDITRAAARFHTVFWDNYDMFGRMGLPWHLESVDHYNIHNDGVRQDLYKFIVMFPDRLNAAEFGCFENALFCLREKMPRIIEERFHAGRNITVIHGDLHPGNTFVSREVKDNVKFVDMEAVRMGLGTDDLAMFLALHTAPGKKADQYLDQYYHELSKSVINYSHENFLEDYRLSVAEAIFHPIGNVGVRMNIYDENMIKRALESYNTLFT